MTRAIIDPDQARQDLYRASSERYHRDQQLLSMDLAVAHIISLEEEWEAAYNNIVEADNVTAAEPEEIAERFETYAQPEITQQSILAGTTHS